MWEKFWRNGQAGLLALRYSAAKVEGIPVDDDRRKQDLARHAIVLPFGGTISDFSLTPDA